MSCNLLFDLVRPLLLTGFCHLFLNRYNANHSSLQSLRIVPFLFAASPACFSR